VWFVKFFVFCFSSLQLPARNFKGRKGRFRPKKCYSILVVPVILLVVVMIFVVVPVNKHRYLPFRFRWRGHTRRKFQFSFRWGHWWSNLPHRDCNEPCSFSGKALGLFANHLQQRHEHFSFFHEEHVPVQTWKQWTWHFSGWWCRCGQ